MKKLLSVVLSLSMILSLFVCYIAVSAETTSNSDIYRIEAESGTRGGVASVIERSTASGGAFVANLGGASQGERDSYVLMTATIPMAGTYKMKVCYKSTAAIPGNALSVNGGDPVTLNYTASADFAIHEVYVVLEKGENTIKISGVQGSDAWGQVDYIEFDLSQNTVRIEAESGVLDGANKGTNGNPSGGYCVGGIGGGSSSEQKASVTMTVIAPMAGRYKLILAANSSDTATESGHNLSINGAAPVTIKYTPSSAYKTYDVIVELIEGENSIKVSGIPGSGAWARLDYIEIDFAKIVDRYEAENGVIVGSNTYKAEDANASGGYKVAGLGGGSSSEQNGSTTMTVTVPTAGVYTIKLRVRAIPEYISAAGSGNNLSVNGEAPITLAYPVSETFIYHEVSVSLNAGENTVKVSGIPGSAAWAHLDCIDVYVPARYYDTDFDALDAALDNYLAMYENNEYCGDEARVNFSVAYENAGIVRNDPDSLQYQVDAAVEGLVTAANALISNGKHVKSEEYTYDEYAHWHTCVNGCDIVFDYDYHHGENGDCTECPNVCEHNAKAEDATCTDAAICSYCGTVVAEKNPENHTKPEEQWINNNNGTHTTYFGCCDTTTDTNPCEYGNDNICDYCGYDRTPVIEEAEADVNNAFENIFKGGENEVEAVGPDGAMSDDYKVIKPADIDGFKYVMFNLHFDENGKVFLRHHFIITGDVTITLNGEAVELKNDGCSANVYYIDAAPEAGKYHIADTITVNGTTEIKASLYSYIKVALESGTLSEKQETLLKALYDLNEAMK